MGSTNKAPSPASAFSKISATFDDVVGNGKGAGDKKTSSKTNAKETQWAARFRRLSPLAAKTTNPSWPANINRALWFTISAKGIQEKTQSIGFETPVE
jgi:hypothetical protein